jgi:hypothetical protein
MVVVLGGSALLGCGAAGIQPGVAVLKETFVVDVDYHSTFRRAQEYFRICHTSAPKRYNVHYVTDQNIDLKGTLTTIKLTKAGESASPLMIFESEPDPTDRDNTRRSVAHITVLGQTPWDAQELAALRLAVQTATPRCVSNNH